MSISVERKLHIASPTNAAVYASLVYARSTGVEIVEVVRQEACYFQDEVMHPYTERIYRRRSMDNGRTWEDDAELYRGEPGGQDKWKMHLLSTILDEQNDLLIQMYFTHRVDPNEPPYARGSSNQRTQRTYYQLSRDGGRSWTDPEQVIDCRSEYDETNWAPGVTYEVQGCRASGQHVFLPDGSFSIGFDIMQPEQPPGFPEGLRTYYINTMYARARLNESGSLDWHFGDMIEVDYPKSMIGCCEPGLASLGGERLYNSMRCQGNEAYNIYATRYTTVSEDGGMTWSAPTPAVYDDGETAWSPASPNLFFVSSVTEKTYVLANFLPGPVYGQMPRYPLSIAEFDTDGACVVRDTLEVIQDLPEGAPETRRYTNFSMYEDRETGELVLQMPEQPKLMGFEEMTKPEDFVSDNVQWRIRFD